jgi:hypothetical protein
MKDIVYIIIGVIIAGMIGYFIGAAKRRKCECEEETPNEVTVPSGLR